MKQIDLEDINSIKRNNCYFIVEKQKKINKHKLLDLLLKLIELKEIQNFVFISYGKIEIKIINIIKKIRFFYLEKNIKIFLQTFEKNINLKDVYHFDNILYLDNSTKSSRQNTIILKQLANVYGEICVYITKNKINNKIINISKKMLVNHFII